MNVIGKQSAGRLVIAALALFAVTGGCAFEDDERCPDGYQWNPDRNYCVMEEEIEEDGGPGADSGSVECVENEAGLDGLDQECFSDADCAGCTADYCLLNPMTPDDPGGCTLSGCESAGCGPDHLCCDCGSVTMIDWPVPLCLVESATQQVVDLG